jgi:hypothetical protein
MEGLGLPRPSRSKSGGGARKHGRMARKPAHKRYNAAHRWEINKARRIAKEKKRQAYIKAWRIEHQPSEQKATTP